MGPGLQMNVQLAPLLPALVVSVLLIRTYIRRRGSALRSVQGPPSSSFIFGWFL
jgi:hypothetical protein